MSRPIRVHLAADDAAQTEAQSRAFVAELAQMPTAVHNLMHAHRSNGEGLCRGCTRPGYGTPYRAWPCELFRLAVRAQRLIEQPVRAAVVA